MKYFATYIFFSCVFLLTAQESSTPEEVTHSFFRAMHDADVESMSALMHKDCTLQSTGGKTDGIKTNTKIDFLSSITTAQPGQLDEQIANLDSRIDDKLANVWMDYSFYYNGVFSHCGVNNFTLTKIGNQWKILSITDSRRASQCVISDAKQQVDHMLDSWHEAASKADSANYFGLMTPTSIYVGTDATEVWSKSEFMAFAAPYFKRGKAWDFKKTSRNIYSDDYLTKVWFDEMLDTWMGPCRGSGVVVKTANGWKIQHYVLSVAVSNDDIDALIKLIEK